MARPEPPHDVALTVLRTLYDEGILSWEDLVLAIWKAADGPSASPPPRQRQPEPLRPARRVQTVVRFLAEHPDHEYTSRQIARAINMPLKSVGPALSTAKASDLVVHNTPWWGATAKGIATFPPST